MLIAQKHTHSSTCHATLKQNNKPRNLPTLFRFRSLTFLFKISDSKVFPAQAKFSATLFFLPPQNSRKTISTHKVAEQLVGVTLAWVACNPFFPSKSCFQNLDALKRPPSPLLLGCVPPCKEQLHNMVQVCKDINMLKTPSFRGIFLEFSPSTSLHTPSVTHFKLETFRELLKRHNILSTICKLPF